MVNITRPPAQKVERGQDPRTGRVTCTVAVTPPDGVEAALGAASAASRTVGASSPATRARWLRAIADALEEPDAAAGLIALADRETALGETRLAAELARTADQLRFYGDAAVEGSYLGVTIDRATPARPSLARVRVPLGPVAVFGASNFPLAFGVLGNDTASALAAGCPVVVKGHPAHPALSARLADLALSALERAGAPDGAFALVTGFDSGAILVRSPRTAAVAFTGSQQGGQHLWRLANERDVVIPVFAEMGTVNPVVLTPAGAADTTEVAAGFVRAFTGGAGQFCTKPGLLFAPSGSGFAAAAGRALERSAPQAWSLTEQIAASAAAGTDGLVEDGATVVARVAGPGRGWSVEAVLLSAPIGAVRPGNRLLEECFGPVALVVEYQDMPELLSVLPSLQGTLAAAIMSGGEQDPDLPRLLDALTPLAGRVVVDGWPTGVATAWGQQHGGPWPATTAPASTSVGAAALDRFTRPVTYQGAPDTALPPPLRPDNPWSVPRRVDGALETGRR
ncbi:aldehyde dehydrogenase family protein [Actinomadura madurae]|uniref:aldehyde dehydrogenase family protein n=1 Tax=Actinomadura madurae TaxID=1993 RepID=UPI0020274AE9|nr:aldehyde dehydrogenase family protein [Actinomadura madurae]URM98880.1 aldehyde dehydrogenase family protein [Actinomadura madurae]